MSARIPDPGPGPRLFSVAEVAGRLGVSVKTVRRMLDRGDLPGHRIGRLLRVGESDLEAYLAGARANVRRDVVYKEA